jgi:hypothetical protein
MNASAEPIRSAKAWAWSRLGSAWNRAVTVVRASDGDLVTLLNPRVVEESPEARTSRSAETYGVSQSTISRAVTAMTPLLSKALRVFVPMADELEPGRQYLVDGALNDGPGVARSGQDQTCVGQELYRSACRPRRYAVLLGQRAGRGEWLTWWQGAVFDGGLEGGSDLLVGGLGPGPVEAAGGRSGQDAGEEGFGRPLV